MAQPTRKDLPAYVRACYEAYIKAEQRNRKAAEERLKFYIGGDLQWREEELRAREQSQRPFITINRCKPAVDQVEGDIRLNPPGPQCHPVGDGADASTADIIEGLIREVESRSNAKTAYATAGKYVAASGEAYLELRSEFTGDREFSQQLCIDSVEDPATVFYDPTSRRANRQDAMWAGKLKMYNKVDYISQFGATRAVLQSTAVQRAGGWIMDRMGVGGNLAEVHRWTGAGEGPFFVAEFYMVTVERRTLRMYTDQIARYDDEPVPPGVTPKVDPNDKKAYTREVPVRTITKHLVDALEELSDPTEWLGSLIPLFPVLGPEVYINGQLHRLSLISGAMDAQRALNYVATTAAELAGLLPKSPWIGAKGAFEDPRWEAANTEMYAYLEYSPVFATDAMGNQVLAPAPQRNNWEAPIQWLEMLKRSFSDDIKATTATYDASLGANKGDQSGKAIEQLRSESNVGNYSYADNLHRAIGILYDQMCCIFPKIYDGPRAVTVVKPDSQHEVVDINRIFGEDGIDPDTGQKGKANNICLGRYVARVTVGKDFDTRNLEAVEALTNFFTVAPQALAVPGIASNFLRMIGQGNPKVEQMADLLQPNDGNEEATPQEMQQKLQQATSQIQAMQEVMQTLAQKLQAKLPEIEAKKFIAAMDNLTRIRVAEINASKALLTQQADAEARQLETSLGMAHETASGAEQREHEDKQQVRDKVTAAGSQAAEHGHATEMAESAADREDARAELAATAPKK